MPYQFIIGIVGNQIRNQLMALVIEQFINYRLLMVHGSLLKAHGSCLEAHGSRLMAHGPENFGLGLGPG